MGDITKSGLSGIIRYWEPFSSPLAVPREPSDSDSTPMDEGLDKKLTERHSFEVDPDSGPVVVVQGISTSLSNLEGFRPIQSYSRLRVV